MKYILVTGASTGIGYAATAELCKHGYGVFAGVRQPADAERLQQAFGNGVTPLLLDVTDGAMIGQAAAQVRERLGDQGLAGLVNNAGIVVAGPLLHLSLDELRHQFEVNVVGLLAITQAVLPLLGARRPCPHAPGRIINVGSVSGRVAFPLLGPYAASKHAVEALSDSLRRELLLYGIDVIVIEPGAVRTPIWDKAAALDTSRYAATDYGPMVQSTQRTAVEQGRRGMPPERIATVIRQALESPHPKSRYPLPTGGLLGWYLLRALPDRWLDWLIARQLGLRKA
jgi:NAD(P)-dependent dehydrogenase (short-subunit alcohol dehydrogenase family)